MRVYVVYSLYVNLNQATYMAHI